MTKSVLCNFAIIQVLPFLNNPKDLNLSYKTDLDFFYCFGRKRKTILKLKKYGNKNDILTYHVLTAYFRIYGFLVIYTTLISPKINRLYLCDLDCMTLRCGQGHIKIFRTNRL